MLVAGVAGTVVVATTPVVSVSVLVPPLDVTVTTTALGVRVVVSGPSPVGVGLPAH